jgi:penicillin-binding protein A
MSTDAMAAIVGAALLIGISIGLAVRQMRSGGSPVRVLDPQRRILVNLGLVLTLGLIGLIGRLLFVSIIRANTVRTRTGSDANGDVLSNPRVIGATLSPGRGRILDRNGEILAESIGQGNISERAFHSPESAHLLGYFSPLRYGLAGVEGTRNQELSGTDPITVREAIESIVRSGQRAGHDVRLTIDADLQRFAAEMLAGVVGSATLIDPRTGRILAMASSPAYDPADLTTDEQGDVATADVAWQELVRNAERPLLLRATSGLYPPGSTFKVFTAAAAIAAGTIKADTVFVDDGSLNVNGRVIPEFNRPDDSRTEWTATEGLAYSLNVVYAQIGLALGADSFSQAAQDFGIGERIPFEFPVAPGQLAGRDDGLANPVALADTAFGQGELLVTPLHMALVMCAIANGGRMPKPILVDAILDPDGGGSSSAKPDQWRRPIDSQSADTVLSMLYEGLSYGYASRAAIPGLNVAAKTGTAESGQEAPHGWFIGSAGIEAPSVVVSVCLDYGGEGGGLALDIGRELLAAAASG